MSYLDEKMTDTLMQIRLSDYSDKLKSYDWWVFEIIVSMGISEEKEAKEICVDEIIKRYGVCVSEDTVWRSIKFLVNINFFTVMKINTGYRNFNILNLTDVGDAAYMLKYKKKPAVPEHKRLAGEHASYHHGYTIKDAKTILEKKPIYISVETGRNENTIRFPDGTAYIPDIRAFMSLTSVHYYEIECGNHHQVDINAKCDKMARLTRNIIFVGQNRKIVCSILKRQLESWIEQRGRINLLAHGIKVYLTTMSDLDANKWTYIYDMKTDEPSCCFRENKNKKETIIYE